MEKNPQKYIKIPNETPLLLLCSDKTEAKGEKGWGP